MIHLPIKLGPYLHVIPDEGYLLDENAPDDVKAIFESWIADVKELERFEHGSWTPDQTART